MTRGHEARILRVIDYINANLDGDLSLDVLADVAALSRFHWHRVFRAYTGESVAVVIRRIRLNRAACDLVQTADPVAVIAARCGYGGVPAFTRAFRDAYGLPPAAFRERGVLLPLLFNRIEGDETMYPVEIISLPDVRVAAMAHRGPYNEIGMSYEKLEAIMSARRLWPHVRGMLALYYDDPDATPVEELRSHAGVIVDEAMEMPDALDDVPVAGGRYAVMHFKGPYSGFAAAYRYVYGPWLSQSGEELRDAPAFEKYLNSPRDTAPDDLLTDICVPLK